jgi:hypothetical protein
MNPSSGRPVPRAPMAAFVRLCFSLLPKCVSCLRLCFSFRAKMTWGPSMGGTCMAAAWHEAGPKRHCTKYIITDYDDSYNQNSNIFILHVLGTVVPSTMAKDHRPCNL